MSYSEGVSYEDEARRLVAEHVIGDDMGSLIDAIAAALSNRDDEWSTGLKHIVDVSYPSELPSEIKKFVETNEASLKEVENRIADELERVADRIRRQKI